MICIGYRDEQKLAEIAAYCERHGLRHIVAISADGCPLDLPGADHVPFSQVIMYVTFYRLLQEITPDTLVVLNECLRTQNRYDLAYNCVRNYLNLTRHQLIFQQLPQIDTADDFMVLFDFDTRSRWKRRPFDPQLVKGEVEVRVRPLPIAFERIDVPTSAKTQAKYKLERDRLFRDLGKRDPHIIPRQLYLIGGHDKRAYIDSLGAPLWGEEWHFVARNRRLGRPQVVTYAEATEGREYGVVELPHRFIDYSDFVRRTWQARSRVLVADLPVDRWYFQRYTEWSERIHATYASLS